VQAPIPGEPNPQPLPWRPLALLGEGRGETVLVLEKRIIGLENEKENENEKE
jgi:hypothetical protein